MDARLGILDMDVLWMPLGFYVRSSYRTVQSELLYLKHISKYADNCNFFELATKTQKEYSRQRS